MYSNLRFVISASLVGCAGLIGVLALLPATFEERLLAGVELSDPPAPACNQHSWLRFDRNCLSRRGMPWVTKLPATKADVAPVESAPEQPSDTQATTSAPASTEVSAAAEVSTSMQASASSQPLVAAAQQAVQPADIPAPRQEAPEAPTSAPIVEEPQVATQQSEAAAPQEDAAPPPVTGERRMGKPRNVARPRHAAPPPAAAERHAAKPTAETPPATPAKKATREDRAAKTNEALNAVRKFQDNLRDIPVSSYAADGTRRTIVIRPTSIQDVYYYSAPR